jgi:hypothetical protein
VYYETLNNRAKAKLEEAITFATLLDTGGVFCPLLIGGCGGAGSPKATEIARVEKLGMVVTVVSAESREAMERYLDGQGVNRAAADVSSLDPYFGETGYAFVCGWVASREEPVAATGLKIVFPSPTIWFPLLPTRAYTNDVETVVYVRGFVKPADGCDLAGLNCEYIYGKVEEVGTRLTFDKNLLNHSPGHPYSWRKEPLTRVTLATDPQKWDRDLELVPGTTAAADLALAVTGWLGLYGPVWSALLGATIGIAIPWWGLPRGERRRIDWFAGPLIGAAIVLSIWASAVVFAWWRYDYLRYRTTPPRWFIVLPGLALVHLAVVFAACQGLIAVIARGT